MTNNDYCRDCVFFGGATEWSCTCNYILVRGEHRPCGPNRECTVKIKRRRRRKYRVKKKGGVGNGSDKLLPGL